MQIRFVLLKTALEKTDKSAIPSYPLGGFFKICTKKNLTIKFDCRFEFPVVKIGQVAITRASDHDVLGF